MGKYLARMLKKKREIKYIEIMHNKNGGLVYSTNEIVKEFRNYFEALYTVGQKGQQEQEKKGKIEEFLNNARLPLLSESDRSHMDSPITEEEIYKALKDSAPGKSPGPDGFTIHYLKKYKATLVPKLCLHQ